MLKFVILCGFMIYGTYGDTPLTPFVFAGTRQVTDCKERGTAGLICSACDAVAKCVQKGDGEWETIQVDKCVGKEKCNLKEGGCSEKPGPCDSGENIQCHGEGLFPDPYDCQKYHFCGQNEQNSVAKECGGNWAFNAANGKCDLDASKSEVCSELPPICPKAGQSGPWKGDPNTYYVCVAKVGDDGTKTLSPELYKCGNGHIYVNDTVGCIKKEGSTTTTATTTTPTTVRPGSTVPQVCTSKGKFPDPKNSQRYYVCREIGAKPVRKSCDWGEYFHPKKLKCVWNWY